MHIYLIITKDEKQAFVYGSVNKGKEKEKELGEENAIVFEWIDLWCRPLNFSMQEGQFDDSPLPWRMLKLAKEQGNWNTRAKYKEDYFNSMINKLS